MSSLRLKLACACGATAVLVALAAPAMAQTRPRPAPPAASAARISVGINGGVSALAHTFSQTVVLPVNGENGSLSVGYKQKSAPLIDASVGFRLRRQLSVSVAFSRSSRRAGADVTADIPHPFFFNQFRNIQGSVGGARHRESAVHVDVMWTLPTVSGLEVNVFAGPTFLSVRQDLVSTVTYDETYPFDSATFTGAPTTGRSKSAVGFNAGVDVAKYLTRSFGIGGILRASGATAKLDSPLGAVSVKAGGLEAGAGIRLRF
ncbi:MAG: hypothetical protein ABI634_06370 [Acidobacteriota bacterium]